MQKHSESARGTQKKKGTTSTFPIKMLVVYLSMYYDIAAAAFLPANTPGRVVAPFSSATRQPRRFVSSPAVILAMRGLGEVPNDMIDGHTSLCRKKSC